MKIPGIYVDAVVVGAPEDNSQCLGMPYDGALAGEFRIPTDYIPPLPMDVKKVIARRAAMELPRDAIVNLGTGAPEKIAGVCAEEGITDRMTLTVESGHIAGIPLRRRSVRRCGQFPWPFWIRMSSLTSIRAAVWTRRSSVLPRPRPTAM